MRSALDSLDCVTVGGILNIDSEISGSTDKAPTYLVHLQSVSGFIAAPICCSEYLLATMYPLFSSRLATNVITEWNSVIRKVITIYGKPYYVFVIIFMCINTILNFFVFIKCTIITVKHDSSRG